MIPAALLGRSGLRPSLGKQHSRVVRTERQPIADIAAGEIHAVDHLRILPRQDDRFDLVGILAPSPLRPAVRTFLIESQFT